MNPDYGRNSKIYWTLIESMDSLRENLTPALQGIVIWLALQLSLQKAVSLFYQDSCFRVMVNSVIMGPVPHFFAVKRVLWSEHYCKARWIRHSVSTCLVVLHTGKHCIQGRQIHIQSVYSLMSLPWCKWLDVINLPPGSWPITPGNGSVLGMDVGLWFWQISTQQ